MSSRSLLKHGLETLSLRRRARRPAKRIQPQIAAHVETIEPRLMLAAAALTATLNTAGVLQILGTDNADNITVRQKNGAVSVDGIKINANGKLVSTVAATSLTQIKVFGYGGNDTILLNSEAVSGQQALAVGAQIVGGDADDTIVGTTWRDQIWGEYGNDKIWGGKGNDDLMGGFGNDELMGGDGDDRLWGSYGNDKLWGEAGDDYMTGESGDDLLYGGTGIDRFDGGLGYDKASIDRNDKILFSNGDGTDTVVSARTIYGSRSTSLLFGSNGYALTSNDTADISGTLNGVVLSDFNPTQIAVQGSGDNKAFHFSDINQASSPTCSFASSLSAVARTSFNFGNSFQFAGYSNGAFQYWVKIHTANGSGYRANWVATSYNGTVSSNDLQRADSGEFWTTLAQRAYLAQMGTATTTFRNMGVAMSAITGAATTQASVGSSSATAMRNALAAGDPVIAATKSNLTANSNSIIVGSPGLVTNHAYTVLAVSPVYDLTGATGGYMVTLRNPWGVDTVGTPLDGVNDAVIQVSWNDFVRYYGATAIGNV